jgi:hypothetical protein
MHWLGAIPALARRPFPSGVRPASAIASAVATQRPAKPISATLTALLPVLFPVMLPLSAAHADPLVDHDAMVQQLIQQQHANPLVADCAAHAAFVVPTSRLYDHVEFLPAELDEQHATTEPWNQPFDDRKQRVNVETMVQVSGLGYRKDAGDAGQPDLLHFRCGYVQDKLLAFGYNEPPQATPPVTEHASRSRGGARHAVHGRTTRGNGRHATKGATRSTAKASSKSHGNAKSSSRSSGKSAAKSSKASSKTKAHSKSH